MCICFCYSIPLKELSANIRFREGFRGVIKDSAVSMRPRKPYISNNYLNFLGEFEAIFETEGQKSRDTVPLKG
jgi:hypothetical protein